MFGGIGIDGRNIDLDAWCAPGAWWANILSTPAKSYTRQACMVSGSHPTETMC